MKVKQFKNFLRPRSGADHLGGGDPGTHLLNALISLTKKMDPRVFLRARACNSLRGRREGDYGILYLSLVFLMGFMVSPLQAQVQNYGASSKAFVSTHSNVWVGKAETYLNEITYLKTTFVQNNPNGSLSKGTLYLSRPDKMRIEYKSPQELVILSDGQYLIQYDPELDESSKADLEFTPASILLTNPVRFSGKVKVLDVKESGEDVLIKVARTGEEDSGTLTFRFQRYPFDLKGWSVLDHQGQRIVIHLSKEKSRPGTLDYSLFRLHRKKR